MYNFESYKKIKKGDMDAAVKLFEEMKQSECGVDMVSYNTMIKGYCAKKEMEPVKKLTKEIEDSG